MRATRRFVNQLGFSELEFALLAAGGLLIAGILAHFVFDQNLQVEKLHALVARDSVRMTLESRLINPEVLLKSAEALDPNNQSTANLRACLLGDRKCPSLKGHCCQSRLKKSMRILDLGEDAVAIAGTYEDPACLDEKGRGIGNGKNCFALSRVVIDPICADGKETCRSATALILHYTVNFQSPFLRDNTELAILERSVSVLLKTDGPYSAP